MLNMNWRSLLSWPTWRFVLSAVQPYCIDGGSNAHSARGGISRAIRCKSVISVALSERSADLKMSFSGISRASRQTIQRKLCKFCETCELIEEFASIHEVIHNSR